MPKMKSSIIQMIVFLLLGSGCIGSATLLSLPSIWRDALLIIGGILVGGFCSMGVLLDLVISKKITITEN